MGRFGLVFALKACLPRPLSSPWPLLAALAKRKRPRNVVLAFLVTEDRQTSRSLGLRLRGPAEGGGTWMNASILVVFTDPEKRENWKQLLEN
jgi:hypothetical protein